MATHYVDSDGHVMERVDEIAKLIERQNGIEGEIHVRRMVPSLDRFHTPRLQRRTPGTFDPAIGPERWMEFLNKTGLEYSVLYPNSFGVFPATRALGMPFPLAIAATGMIVEGMLDQFPKLRIGFLEGGTAWIPIVIDRLEREIEYGGLHLKRKPEDYFKSGRIFVGCEGNERALAYAIERIGPEPFMFASDFPHEISLGNCMEEINEIIERTDLMPEHKTAILGDNARQFYKI